MRFKAAIVSFCALILVAAVLAGCNQSSENSPNDAEQSPNTDVSSSKPVNEVCPIMGGKVTSDGGTAEWDGKLIGFCCPECKPKWEMLSDEEKSEKLAAAAGNAEHGDNDDS